MERGTSSQPVIALPFMIVTLPTSVGMKVTLLPTSVGMIVTLNPIMTKIPIVTPREGLKNANMA